MKDLFKKICFVLLIFSFFIIFSFVGKTEVSAQVTNCTSTTVGDDCYLEDGSIGICKKGVYSNYYCEVEEVDPPQCTSENEGDSCTLEDGSTGICKKGVYSNYYCEEVGEIDPYQCTNENEGEPCDLGDGTTGVCKKGVYNYYCEEDDPDNPYDPDERNWGDEKTAPPPTFEGNVSGIVDKVLGYLFPIAGVIALIFIIMGGYMWIVSAGDPNKVKQAQGTLTWAIFGLIIVMVIFGVIRILINFLS
jgi:hypothetical protein